MIHKRLRLFGGGVLLCLCALSLLQWRGYRQLHSLHEETLARRLQQLASPLVEKGHRANDDLLTQQITQTLGGVSGVKFAAVLDPQNRILTHSDPAHLGQTFRASERTGLRRYALGEGSASWGTLIFSSVDSSFLRTADRQFKFFCLGLGVSGLILIISAANELKTQETSRQRILDLTTLLEDEKQSRWQTHAQTLKNEALWQIRLQAAVDEIPQESIFLDAHQRVVAIYRRPDLIGKSWHEVDLLQNLGPSLEKSLESLGPPLLIEQDGTQWKICNLQNRQGELAGTWLTRNFKSARRAMQPFSGAKPDALPKF